MALIQTGPGVPREQFTQGVEPQPGQAPTTSARLLGDGGTADSMNGVRAGQLLNLDFFGYFEPPPQNEGPGSFRIRATAEVSGQTIVAEAQGDGWWGYGSRIPLPIPPNAQGPMTIRLDQLRLNGEVVPHGRTYTADVLPAETTVIKFTDNWDQETNGELRPGDAFKICYDVDRLVGRIPLQPDELPVVNVYVSFDGQYPQSRSVLSYDALGQMIDTPEFRIPDNAREMRVWFSGGVANKYTPPERLVWDSDFGRDFYTRLP